MSTAIVVVIAALAIAHLAGSSRTTRARSCFTPATSPPIRFRWRRTGRGGTRRKRRAVLRPRRDGGRTHGMDEATAARIIRQAMPDRERND